MDGRWGTVCNNSQEGIAGAVCSQLGWPSEGLSHKHIFIAIIYESIYCNQVLCQVGVHEFPVIGLKHLTTVTQTSPA